MASELTASEYDVKIRFDPSNLKTDPKTDPFTFQVNNGPVEDDFSIEVNTNVAVVHFFLQTLTDDLDQMANLATGPIQWLTASGSASPMPPAFFLRREGETKMTLVDLNDVQTPSSVTFNFEIAVVYQGRTYTSPDPTIINVQPPPPPEVERIQPFVGSAELVS